MGRRPTRNLNLPAGMRARHRPSGIHYYLDTGSEPRREIPLGKDYAQAVMKWAELTATDRPGSVVTLKDVAREYIKHVLPNKAPRTRKDNLKELENLYKFFNEPPVPLEDIQPINVRQYLNWRGATAKVRANREKALLSHIWNFARDKGYTALPNPCAGIKGFKEVGRDIYVDDPVFEAVWNAAEEPLRDAVDLAYLTGQRPADVLKLSRTDIKDGALWVEQNKTGKKLRINITGKLAAVIQRVTSRKVTSLMLVASNNGYGMSSSALRGAFDRARIRAAKESPELADAIKAFQFRDLRAKAGTDKEESSGMGAAKDQLGHTTEGMTARYVRHRKGKLVEPTR